MAKRRLPDAHDYYNQERRVVLWNTLSIVVGSVRVCARSTHLPPSTTHALYGDKVISCRVLSIRVHGEIERSEYDPTNMKDTEGSTHPPKVTRNEGGTMKV